MLYYILFYFWWHQSANRLPLLSQCSNSCCAIFQRFKCPVRKPHAACWQISRQWVTLSWKNEEWETHHQFLIICPFGKSCYLIGSSNKYIRILCLLLQFPNNVYGMDDKSYFGSKDYLMRKIIQEPQENKFFQ